MDTCYFLREYYNGISIMDSFAAPHHYRSRLREKDGHKKKILANWNIEEQKVIDSYLKKVNEIFPSQERIYIFNAPTNNPIFINGIRQELIKVKNPIDGTECFKKNAPVQFGSQEFSNIPIAELLQFIDIDEQLIENIIDKSIVSALIIDDVYQSGKSSELLRYLINLHFPHIKEIKTLVILKMPPNQDKDSPIQKEIDAMELEVDDLRTKQKANPENKDYKLQLIILGGKLDALKSNRNRS